MTPIANFACLIIIIAGMKAASPILNPLFLSIFTATLCWPGLTWLVNRKIPSSVAVSLIILCLMFTLSILGAYVFSSVHQFSKALPSYQANLSKQTASLTTHLHEFGIIVPEERELLKQLNAGKLMQFAGSLLSGLGDVFTNIVFILLTVVFLLFETFLLPQKIFLAFNSPTIHNHAERIIDSLNRYIGIKVLTSLVTGLLISICLYWVGVDFPVLWGVIAFMFNFVPNIGSIIAAIPTVLLTFVQLGPNSALLVIITYVTVNTIVGNVWEPRIMGRGLGLSTLVVFLSLTFWGWVFGTVGMLLSVPFTMIAKIILENDPNTKWIAVLLSSEDDLQLTAIADSTEENNTA